MEKDKNVAKSISDDDGRVVVKSANEIRREHEAACFQS